MISTKFIEDLTRQSRWAAVAAMLAGISGLAQAVAASSSLLAATMNQKSSLREVPQLVSWVLTGNNAVAA